jgi:hypothetical protein
LSVASKRSDRRGKKAASGCGEGVAAERVVGAGGAKSQAERTSGCLCGESEEELNVDRRLMLNFGYEGLR